MSPVGEQYPQTRLGGSGGARRRGRSRRIQLGVLFVAVRRAARSADDDRREDHPLIGAVCGTRTTVRSTMLKPGARVHALGFAAERRRSRSARPARRARPRRAARAAMPAPAIRRRGLDVLIARDLVERHEAEARDELAAVERAAERGEPALDERRAATRARRCRNCAIRLVVAIADRPAELGDREHLGRATARGSAAAVAARRRFAAVITSAALEREAGGGELVARRRRRRSTPSHHSVTCLIAGCGNSAANRRVQNATSPTCGGAGSTSRLP